MDFASYADLQSAIADFLGRDDLGSQIPGFIALAEAKIKRRVRRKTIFAALDVSTESTTLPTDLAELRSLVPATGTPSADRALTIGTLAMLADTNARRAGAAGRPQLFAVVDDQLRVAPKPDQTYTLNASYFQKLVPLSSGNTTNTVLDEAPDIYLYGALAEAAPYLEHDERVALWKQLFSDACDELDTVRQREETAASLQAARLPVVFG